MPSKNDLSALKNNKKSDTVLPDTQEASLKKNMGRPPKNKSEKRSYKVVISMTEEEGQKLSEASGLARDATYLYSKLKEIGVI